MLSLRDADDDLIEKFRRRTARHGRSTEAEHREILRRASDEEVEPSFESLAAELRKLTEQRHQTPSEVLLRQARDQQ